MIRNDSLLFATNSAFAIHNSHSTLRMEHMPCHAMPCYAIGITAQKQTYTVNTHTCIHDVHWTMKLWVEEWTPWKLCSILVRVSHVSFSTLISCSANVVVSYGWECEEICCKVTKRRQIQLCIYHVYSHRCTRECTFILC